MKDPDNDERVIAQEESRRDLASPLINKDPPTIDDVLKYLVMYAFRRGNAGQPIAPNNDSAYTTAKQQIIDLINREVVIARQKAIASYKKVNKMLENEIRIDELERQGKLLGDKDCKYCSLQGKYYKKRTAELYRAELNQRKAGTNE